MTERTVPRFDTATVGEWCAYARDAEAEIARLDAEAMQHMNQAMENGVTLQAVRAELAAAKALIGLVEPVVIMKVADCDRLIAEAAKWKNQCHVESARYISAEEEVAELRAAITEYVAAARRSSNLGPGWQRLLDIADAAPTPSERMTDAIRRDHAAEGAAMIHAAEEWAWERTCRRGTKGCVYGETDHPVCISVTP